MKLGVIQGRLSPPVEGFQECPVNWRREFHFLDVLNLNHIEWIITKNSFDVNPALVDTQSLKNLKISSICCDHLVDDKIDELSFLEAKLVPICLAAEKCGVSTIGIPLLEASAVEEKRKRKNFIESIQKIHLMFPNLTFSFEAELKAEEILEIVSVNKKFTITYDTGNITSHCGPMSHNTYIIDVFSKIDIVHLKDRVYDGSCWKTVFPTTGHTNFKIIFQLLKNLGYSGYYTLQTARNLDGLEIETIKYHKLILEKIYNDANIVYV